MPLKTVCFLFGKPKCDACQKFDVLTLQATAKQLRDNLMLIAIELNFKRSSFGIWLHNFSTRLRAGLMSDQTLHADCDIVT